MAAFTTIAAVIGLTLSVVGTVVQQQAQKKAQKQSQRNFNESQALKRQAEERQQKLSDLTTLRAKRSAARDAQSRRADVTSAAEGAGANEAGGSTVPGARGSINRQLSSNLSFLDKASALNTQTVALLGEANEVGSRPVFTSSIGNTIAGFGGTIFENSGKIGGLFEGAASAAPGPGAFNISGIGQQNIT